MVNRSWRSGRLTTLIADQFDAITSSRGAAYYHQGQVQLVDHGPSFALALVQGRDTYETDLRLTGQRLIAACTCPRYADGHLCKHIWATALAAEAKGALEAALHSPTLAVVRADDLDLDDGPDQTADDDGDEDLDPLEPEIWPPPARRKKRIIAFPARSAPPVPQWQQVLTGIKARTRPPEYYPRRESWPAGQELIYLLDAGRETASGSLARLQVLCHRPKKNGEWTKPQPFRIRGEETLGAVPDSLDRRVLAMLVGGTANNAYTYYLNESFSVTDELLGLLLPLLGQTGRFRVRGLTDPEPAPGVLHGYDDGAPWRLHLRLAPRADGPGYALRGVLERGDESMDLAEPVLLLSGGWVFARGLAARLHDEGTFGWLWALRQFPELHVPPGDGERFVEHLLGVEGCPPIELPEELRYQERSVPPRPRLELRRHTSPWYRDRLSAVVSFQYDGMLVAAEPKTSGVFDAARREFLRRDAAAEAAAIERLRQWGFTVDHTVSPPGAGLLLRAKRLPKVLPSLLAENWLVEAEGQTYRRGGDFRLNVRSGIDWFEVHGGLEFDGARASLPALLAAARRGDSMVVLDDGSLGVLPEDWLRQWGMLATGQAEEDHLRFRRGQTALLDALLASRPEVSGDATFQQAREELRRFTTVEPADPPATFRGQLRAYQREGLGWLHFLRRFGLGGCLADDMGLGKTVQVLALLETRRQKREMAGNGEDRGPVPSLVVVPRSVLYNWRQEAARFTPGLRVLEHSGLTRQRTAIDFSDQDLVLTTYGTLRRDIALLQDATFDYVILDEAQAVKNADTATAKAVRLLRGEHRLALSGTPIENHLGELWSLMEFLNPGMLGSGAAFQEQVRRDDGAGGLDRTVLSRALRPVILRRTKAQVARDLPARTEQTLFCELEGEQRREYQRLRAYYHAALLGRVEQVGLARAKIQVLEALLRLRQAACHLGLIDKARAGESSAKLEALLPQLAQVTEEGHKVLVFSQFTGFLGIVRARLDAEGIPYAYLDGRTRDRAQRVERFQTDPNCLLFLISLKAGGLGLNLTAAEYVFLLDPWWNPAVEAQAIDRTHRIGQTRRVFAYRLIARGTVEEKVLELQQVKRDLADAILGADHSLIRTLTREDLETLLS